MGGNQMKKVTLIVLSTLMLVVATGCGKDNDSITAKNVTKNAIIIKKNNTVQSSVVEDFDKDYYSSQELEEFIEEEMADYNGKHGKDAVAMDSIHITDQKASVVFNYKSIEEYAEFNNVNAHIVTMEEASSNEDINQIAEFIDYKTDETVEKMTALSNPDAKVLIVEEALEIKLAGEIQYYSNADKTDKNVLQSNGNGITVVVFTPKK